MVGVPRKPSKPVDPNQSWERASLLPMEKGSAGDVRLAVPQMLLDLFDALALPGDVLTGKAGGLMADPETGQAGFNMDPEVIGRAAGFPAQISMPGLGAASAQALTQGLDPNQLNVFIGPQGAERLGGWGDLHPDNFLRADEAYKKLDYRPSSQDVQSIFEDTKIFPGKDTKMRMELPDYPELDALFPDVDAAFLNAIKQSRARMGKGMEVDPNDPFDKLDMLGSKMEARGTMPTLSSSGRLDHIIYHPALFEAYPELKMLETNTSAHPNLTPQGAFWANAPGSPDPRIDAAAGTNGDLMSVLLHEIQHGIQRAEGFDTGGSPDYTRNIIAGVAPQADTQLQIASPYTLYKALSGETEARNVQQRYEVGTAINFPYNQNPLLSEDVPRHLQVRPNQLWAPNPQEYPEQNAQMLAFLKMLGDWEKMESAKKPEPGGDVVFRK